MPYPYPQGQYYQPGPQPFNQAIAAIKDRAGIVIGATAVWALLWILLFGGYIGTLYYLDEVAGYSQHQLNNLAPYVVGAFFLVFVLLSTFYIGITHARAAEIFAGSTPGFASFFSLRDSFNPMAAYVFSKLLVYAPVLGLGAVITAKWEQDTLPMEVVAACILIAVWVPIVAYLTLFATAAATEVNPIRAIGRSVMMTTRHAGGTWATIGVIFLGRLLEAFTSNLASIVVAPYLSFALVSKYQELRARELAPQNFAGGGAGYPIY